MSSARRWRKRVYIRCSRRPYALFSCPRYPSRINAFFCSLLFLFLSSLHLLFLIQILLKTRISFSYFYPRVRTRWQCFSIFNWYNNEFFVVETTLVIYMQTKLLLFFFCFSWNSNESNVLIVYLIKKED